MTILVVTVIILFSPLLFSSCPSSLYCSLFVTIAFFFFFCRATSTVCIILVKNKTQAYKRVSPNNLFSINM